MVLNPNHFADEEDADFRDLTAARAHAALAWGHFQGQLAYLDNRVAQLFAVGVARAMCDEALCQAGYPDASLKLPQWFAGQPLNVETAHVAAPAKDLVTAVLHALRGSSWGPMAAVADKLFAANCMVRDRLLGAEPLVVEEAIAEGVGILKRLNTKANREADSPLAIIDELHKELAISPLMPLEAGGAMAIKAPDCVFHVSAPPQRGFL